MQRAYDRAVSYYAVTHSYYTGKMSVLLRLLHAFRAVGDSCIVFTQSIPVLDMVEKLLLGTEWVVDGRTVGRGDGTVGKGDGAGTRADGVNQLGDNVSLGRENAAAPLAPTKNAAATLAPTVLMRLDGGCTPEERRAAGAVIVVYTVL
jgi:hypothetical protein